MKNKKPVKAKKKAVLKKSKKTAAPKGTKSPSKHLGQFKHFLSALNAKREEILNVSKEKDVDTSFGEAGDEADVASQTYEREMMFELTNAERMVLDDVEAALRRIEKGNFGLCESCGTKITPVRLNAMPWARNCIGCQSKNERPRG
jgi:DnaK suppressor protein